MLIFTVAIQFLGLKMCRREKTTNTRWVQKDHMEKNNKYEKKRQIQGMLKRRGDMCGSRASQRAGMQSLVARTSLLNLTSSDTNPIVYSPHSYIGGAKNALKKWHFLGWYIQKANKPVETCKYKSSDGQKHWLATVPPFIWVLPRAA